MPLTILNFSRAWRAHFLSITLQTWQSCLFFVDLQLIFLSLLDMYDYIEFEKSEKAFLSICSELLELKNGEGHQSFPFVLFCWLHAENFKKSAEKRLMSYL